MLNKNQIQMAEATKNFNFDMNGGVSFMGDMYGWEHNLVVDYSVHLQIGEFKRNHNGYDIYMTDSDVCVSKTFMVKEIPCNKYWTTNERLIFGRYIDDIEFEEVLNQIINKDWMKKFNVNQSENNRKYLAAFKNEMIRILKEKGLIVYGKCFGKTQYWEARLVDSYGIEVLENE